MRERILTFGPRQGLVGIYSEPDPAHAKPDAPVLISSNVGMNHRIGPYRLYVDLARQLAASGYGMLRFDLSGMGDSAPRLDDKSEGARALADLQDAMDAIGKLRPASHFVQLGFCSSVDSAHAVTLAEARVVGAIFLEGYTFRTRRFYAGRYLRRPLTRRFWSMYTRRKLRTWLGSLGPARREVGELENVYMRSYPAVDRLTADYQAMIARGVQMLFVYCGGMGADAGCNYAGQFADVFPSVARDPHVQLEFYPTADHVYSMVSDRAKLIDRIERWLGERFP